MRLAKRVRGSAQLPEPAREGEAGPDDCSTCRDGADRAIWEDDDWILLPMAEPNGLSMIVTLTPRPHHDLADLPVTLSRDLGSQPRHRRREDGGGGGTARV